MTTVVVFLDKNSTSPWTVPADWNSGANTIEVGSAAGGTADDNVAFVGPYGGAGGSAYSSVSNVALTPGASVAFVVGVGGGHAAAPFDGGDTWFGNAVYASATVAAKGGLGNDGVTAATAGKSGGAAAAGIGTVKFSGGGGSGTSGASAGAGGGAAGSHGNGNSAAGTTGGSGDAGFGGAGGTLAVAGGNGTEYDATHGWGGGGGAGSAAGTPAAGKYGGGAGGPRLGKVGVSGADGLIVITYTVSVTTTNVSARSSSKFSSAAQSGQRAVVLGFSSSRSSARVQGVYRLGLVGLSRASSRAVLSFGARLLLSGLARSRSQAMAASPNALLHLMGRVRSVLSGRGWMFLPSQRNVSVSSQNRSVLATPPNRSAK